MKKSMLAMIMMCIICGFISWCGKNNTEIVKYENVSSIKTLDYDSISGFAEVEKDRKKGYFNQNGKEVIECI